MNKAIIGKKLGMSQIFTADGTVIPVTVVEAGPCPVVQVKTKDRDGYEAVKVAFGAIKKNNVNKPDAGQFKKPASKQSAYLKSSNSKTLLNTKSATKSNAPSFRKAITWTLSALRKVTAFRASFKDGTRNASAACRTVPVLSTEA